ncbi:MAG: Gmad2 immunoglobulin-like domain-containing protein [Candidatus Nealsonbacteria bacterium]
MNKKIILAILVILILGGAAAYFKFYSNSVADEISPSGLVIVTSPRANQTVQSPLIVKGEAKGFWFFEASFPIKILDENGNVLGQGIAQAKSDWMTEEFVPFEATLDFEAPVTEKGFLVLKKDNPSGLPENDAEFRIPVVLEKTQAKQTIDLYYYNPELDKDESGNIMCSKQGLVQIQRKIPVTQTPIQDTIKLLIKGELIGEERERGISTEYPLPGFSLESVPSFKDGVLTLQFNDPDNKTGGGACRVGILWFQIEDTAKQFAGVTQVRFLPEDLFQP